jgi:hypothetical protein
MDLQQYDSSAIKLTTERGRKSRPDYASQELAQQAKAVYEDIGAWVNA